MKILLASYWPLPSSGGIWTYVKELRKGLEQSGHAVDILACHPTLPLYYLEQDGRTLEKTVLRKVVKKKGSAFYEQFFPQADKWMIRYEVERYCFELAAAYFGLGRYDLIHAQDVISTRALARVKAHDTPLVATWHGSLPHEIWHNRLIENRDSLLWRYLIMQDYFAATASDRTIVPSQWMKQLLIEEVEVLDEQLQVIPYGIDLSDFRKRMEEPCPMQSERDKKVILCTARLDEVKGHRCLLQALQMLKRVRQDWVCWLVGEGVLKDQLIEQCAQCDLSNDVLILGGRGDVPSLLKRADLFVLPSLQDNQPFALLEAQIAGCAAVVSDAGGIPEMVLDNKTAWVTPAGEPEALFRHMHQALSDEPMRKRLAQNAQEGASSKWTLERMTRHTLQVYQQVGGGTWEEWRRGGAVARQETSEPDAGLIPPDPNVRRIWRRILRKVPVSYQIPDWALLQSLRRNSRREERR